MLKCANDWFFTLIENEDSGRSRVVSMKGPMPRGLEHLSHQRQQICAFNAMLKRNRKMPYGECRMTVVETDHGPKKQNSQELLDFNQSMIARAEFFGVVFYEGKPNSDKSAAISEFQVLDTDHSDYHMMLAEY